MTKRVTAKGALSAAFDVLKMALYIIGGIAGVMYASVMTADISMWFYIATGVYLLFAAVKLLGKVTKPTDNYEVQEIE
jgi:hypothetical protein